MAVLANITQHDLWWVLLVLAIVALVLLIVNRRGRI